MVVSIRVGADDGRVTGEVFFAEFQAKSLCLFHGQAVVGCISGVEADDILVTLDITMLGVLAILAVCQQTGRCKREIAALKGVEQVGFPQEVTSITLEQFRFLRDGGPYINQATGQEEHFAGHLFDPVVFDDSVKEFLNLKVKLADYFDESRTEDIFDYIPPQKTNQIFTPKWVVKKMVDLLEQENPGCFDDPGKTFLDPDMKSGLYITEIVKRLYRSEKMRQIFPDDNARLEHIFAKQVYGLAPTEIIYRIAISYILGFAKDHGITAHHIRQADTLEFAKAGTMERELDKSFRD